MMLSSARAVASPMSESVPRMCAGTCNFLSDEAVEQAVDVVLGREPWSACHSLQNSLAARILLAQVGDELQNLQILALDIVGFVRVGERKTS